MLDIIKYSKLIQISHHSKLFFQILSFKYTQDGYRSVLSKYRVHFIIEQNRIIDAQMK